jgi:hypothetical protein
MMVEAQQKHALVLIIMAHVHKSGKKPRFDTAFFLRMMGILANRALTTAADQARS